MCVKELDKLERLRQQKREYYYRNRDTIRYNQKCYQTKSDSGRDSVRKAKAKYYQTKIKKTNGGHETDAHIKAKLKYNQKQLLYSK